MKKNTLLLVLIFFFTISLVNPWNHSLAQSPDDDGFDPFGKAISTPTTISSSIEELSGEWVRAYLLQNGRSLATSVALPDGSIVFMGGTYSAIKFADVQRSTDAGAAWWRQVVGSAEWGGRSGHTSVVLPDGSILLMGGSGSTDFNDVWRSTDQGATWTQMTASAEWTPRYSHTSVVLPDGSIVLMGGRTVSGNRFNDVWRSTNNGASWTQMTANAEWSERSGHTSVALSDGSIVLIGGSDESNRFNDVWRSTDNGATWTVMTTNAEWTARNGHTSVLMPDGNIVLMGGYDGVYKHDVWRSTNNGANWSQMTGGAAWVSRSAHTCVSLPDGSIVLMSGFKSQGVGLNTWYEDVWRSTDQGATWTKTFTSFGARDGHTSVTLPDSGIVMMGGYVGTSSYSRFVYHSTDKGANWTLLTVAAQWSGRYNHSSVALPDGSIVLMGGRVDGGYSHSVHRSTDQGANWTMLTSAAEWAGRMDHASVVLPDGSIVLMGGSPGSVNLFNDVWRSTDNGATWTEMTSSAEWVGRRGHTSVVLEDGSILLMGGLYYENGTEAYMNDVWQSTDNGATWTQVISSAPWSARHNHTSVVLPDGGIVVMGGDDGMYRRDVWRSTDNGATWTDLGDANWGPRAHHTSVTLSDGDIVLIGGEQSNGDLFGDVWQLKTPTSPNYAIYLPLAVRTP